MDRWKKANRKECMANIVISGTGVYTPPNVVTNAELVDSYNRWAAQYNDQNATEITGGELDEKQPSSVEFIEKASGIKQRYMMVKDGVLDIDRMMPRFPKQETGELSTSAEMGIAAAHEALQRAGKQGSDVDLIIGCSSTSHRPWPATAIEIQEQLGAGGFGFDMSVACSTATYAISVAADMIAAGTANCALVINPEILAAQINYRDRDSHFIFGDAATAVVVERADTATSGHQFRILDKRLISQFSSNIRSNFGFLTRVEPDLTLDRFFEPDQWFVQQGRKVFRELLPIAAGLIEKQLGQANIPISDIRRMWLHQANVNMNMFAAKKILGREPEPGEAPIILDEYANTASAGCIIAFHKFQDDLETGDKGIISSFGGGYTVGSIIVEKM